MNDGPVLAGAAPTLARADPILTLDATILTEGGAIWHLTGRLWRVTNRFWMEANRYLRGFYEKLGGLSYRDIEVSRFQSGPPRRFYVSTPLEMETIENTNQIPDYQPPICCQTAPFFGRSDRVKVSRRPPGGAGRSSQRTGQTA